MIEAHFHSVSVMPFKVLTSKSLHKAQNLVATLLSWWLDFRAYVSPVPSNARSAINNRWTNRGQKLLDLGTSNVQSLEN